MDYIEAELEARIFPSVDVDPMDYMTDEELDEQYGNETYFEDPWSEAWMDANALESAGMGEDDGGGDIDW
jgi:hypothetical protein